MKIGGIYVGLDADKIKTNPLDTKKHITPDVALFNKMCKHIMDKEEEKEREILYEDDIAR